MESTWNEVADVQPEVVQALLAGTHTCTKKVEQQTYKHKYLGGIQNALVPVYYPPQLREEPDNCVRIALRLRWI